MPAVFGAGAARFFWNQILRSAFCVFFFGERMRNRYKHTTTLEERLLKAAEDLRAKAKELLPGKDRDTLLEKARQFENQVSTNELFVPPQGVDGKSLEP
jgi:hypothetical protein